MRGFLEFMEWLKAVRAAEEARDRVLALDAPELIRMNLAKDDNEDEEEALGCAGVDISGYENKDVESNQGDENKEEEDGEERDGEADILGVNLFGSQVWQNGEVDMQGAEGERAELDEREELRGWGGVEPCLCVGKGMREGLILLHPDPFLIPRDQGPIFGERPELAEPKPHGPQPDEAS
ncbi:hypothetical protein FRC12_005556 [Ceratobasidium sp. 428]|nr:hypothetical protein FRC12_005556 [Ceratobasidium sp. 428]